MTTTTDTMWTERLATVMPANFMGNISNTFQANQNLLDAMINRIGLTVISGVDSPYNPFAKYTGPVVDYGDQVQKYKIDFIKGEQFHTDNSEAEPDRINPFKPVRRNPYAQYVMLDDSVQYHETITNYEFKKAFTSDAKLGDFVSAKLDAMYESDGLDKYIKWKKYLSDAAKFGKLVGIETDDSDTDVYAGNLWDAIRLYANSKFRQPSSQYNIAGQTSISPSVDIIMKADDKLLVDKYLKGVYNLEKTDINANFIYVDDFATLANVPETMTDVGDLSAIVMDSRACQYFPRTPEAGSIYNPKGLNMEYYLTIQGTYCVDRFRNVVGIYTKTDASNNADAGSDAGSP